MGKIGIYRKDDRARALRFPVNQDTRKRATMLIGCHNCGKTYSIEDHLIPAEGTTFFCPKCKQVTRIELPPASKPEVVNDLLKTKSTEHPPDTVFQSNPPLGPQETQTAPNEIILPDTVLQNISDNRDWSLSENQPNSLTPSQLPMQETEKIADRSGVEVKIEQSNEKCPAPIIKAPQSSLFPNVKLDPSCEDPFSSFDKLSENEKAQGKDEKAAAIPVQDQKMPPPLSSTEQSSIDNSSSFFPTQSMNDQDGPFAELPQTSPPVPSKNFKIEKPFKTAQAKPAIKTPAPSSRDGDKTFNRLFKSDAFIVPRNKVLVTPFCPVCGNTADFKGKLPTIGSPGWLYISTLIKIIIICFFVESIISDIFANIDITEIFAGISETIGKYLILFVFFFLPMSGYVYDIHFHKYCKKRLKKSFKVMDRKFFIFPTLVSWFYSRKKDELIIELNNDSYKKAFIRANIKSLTPIEDGKTISYYQKKAIKLSLILIVPIVIITIILHYNSFK